MKTTKPITITTSAQQWQLRPSVECYLTTLMMFSSLEAETSFSGQPQVVLQHYQIVFCFNICKHRAVEVAIMTASLYMALWITNFITIVKLYADQHIYFQVYM